ncbi:NADH dehydrogenase [ubiquinone] 1 alpha subcomplex assembly factor 2 [Fundulus heteroclitus]|uniref:NADH dehydrogenase [ubiquinone] 1 alpha subcomplex assembly factor 2 n=1 Tax=Fundulus heteroclitus TaxID=8078 RepID=UPI00165BDED6|nr:NADH dehydrogenase [ubiquinone] 1 alpha subcomplex assembly factor 2 [Fundulus heteroclitus]
MSKIGGLLRRAFGAAREHVGTDHFGNKYYFIPEQKSWTGRHIRAKRMMEPANPAEHEYMEGNIPMEWEAWIRGRRKKPPSVEELMGNESQREQIKLKAKEVEEKDLALQAKEYEEGLVAAPARTVAKGHASATAFGKEELSEEPTSTANKFQPGSWMPTSKK